MQRSVLLAKLLSRNYSVSLGVAWLRSCMAGVVATCLPPRRTHPWRSGTRVEVDPPSLWAALVEYWPQIFRTPSAHSCSPWLLVALCSPPWLLTAPQGFLWLQQLLVDVHTTLLHGSGSGSTQTQRPLSASPRRCRDHVEWARSFPAPVGRWPAWPRKTQLPRNVLATWVLTEWSDAWQSWRPSNPQQSGEFYKTFWC